MITMGAGIVTALVKDFEPGPPIAQPTPTLTPTTPGPTDTATASVEPTDTVEPTDSVEPTQSAEPTASPTRTRDPDVPDMPGTGVGALAIGWAALVGAGALVAVRRRLLI